MRRVTGVSASDLVTPRQRRRRRRRRHRHRAAAHAGTHAGQPVLPRRRPASSRATRSSSRAAAAPTCPAAIPRRCTRASSSLASLPDDIAVLPRPPLLGRVVGHDRRGEAGELRVQADHQGAVADDVRRGIANVVVSVSQPTATLPPVRDDRAKLAQLQVTKRRATGLLIATTGVFLLTLLGDGDRGWLGYVRAAAEASMVGGLADWFAVTALFRHPARAPDPPHRDHPRAQGPVRPDPRRVRAGQLPLARRRSSTASARVAWCAVRRVAGSSRTTPPRSPATSADIVVGVTDTLRDEDVHALIEDAVIARVEAVPLAPARGPGARADDRGGPAPRAARQPVLRGLDRALEENRENLRARFGRESPWWVPEPIDGPHLREAVSTACASCSRRSRSTRSTSCGWSSTSGCAELADRARLVAGAARARRGAEARAACPPAAAAVVVVAVARPEDRAAVAGRRSRLGAAPAPGGRWCRPPRQRLRDDPALQAKAEELAAAGRALRVRALPRRDRRAWSAGRSRAGTPTRHRAQARAAPRAATCSSSASTAPWSEAWPAWPCTRWSC